jgi:hypothetical protein
MILRKRQQTMILSLYLKKKKKIEMFLLLYRKRNQKYLRYKHRNLLLASNLLLLQYRKYRKIK